MRFKTHEKSILPPTGPHYTIGKKPFWDFTIFTPINTKNPKMKRRWTEDSTNRQPPPVHCNHSPLPKAKTHIPFDHLVSFLNYLSENTQNLHLFFSFSFLVRFSPSSSIHCMYGWKAAVLGNEYYLDTNKTAASPAVSSAQLPHPSEGCPKSRPNLTHLTDAFVCSNYSMIVVPVRCIWDITIGIIPNTLLLLPR